MSSELTQAIIGCAVEVHRMMGPGLLDSVYEEALCHEFCLRGIPFKRQQRVPIRYKGIRLTTELRLDLLVDERVIVDVKAKDALASTGKPQLLTYLRLCDLRVGLLINFHNVILKQGITRVVDKYTEALPAPEDPPDFQAPYIN